MLFKKNYSINTRLIKVCTNQWNLLGWFIKGAGDRDKFSQGETVSGRDCLTHVLVDGI